MTAIIARSRGGEAGSSLLETVIALFLLTAAMMVSFQLFHRATALQGDIELRSTALTLAQARMADVRVAAASLPAFRAGLSSEVGTTPAAGHDFLITVAVDDLSDAGEELYSPSSGFEEPFQGPPPQQPTPPHDVFSGAVDDDRRPLPKSALLVDVTVTSNSGRMKPLTLTMLLREPPRRGASVVVSDPSALNVSYPSTAACTARVMDDNGDEIEGVMLQWQIERVSTYATAHQSRSGKMGVVQYVDHDALGAAFQPDPGVVRLKATAKVEGRTLWSDSADITLGP